MPTHVGDTTCRGKDSLWYMHAYEGVEAIENFASREELDKYREHLIEKSNAMAQFIMKQRSTPFRLFEIATGNGRIPVALMEQGAVDYVLGVDISSSRIAFARRWADDMKLKGLDFEVRDVLIDPSTGSFFDMAICLTGAFCYFDASRRGADRQILLELSKGLVPGGTLILEIYTLPVLRRRCLESPDGITRYWERLAQKDPFSFYLHEVKYQEEESILQVQKVFIRRRDGHVDESRCEYLRIYTEEEIERLLEECGFQTLFFSDGFDEKPSRDVWHGTRIAVARNRRGEG